MSERHFYRWLNNVIRTCWKQKRIDVYHMPHIDYWRLFKLNTPVDRAVYLVSLVAD